MKTTLELPDDLMRQLKVRAAIEGRKLKDVVSEALRVGLTMSGSPHHQPKGIRVETDSETGLPTVLPVSDAPGSGITRKELGLMEQDSQYLEDLRRAGLSL